MSNRNFIKKIVFGYFITLFVPVNNIRGKDMSNRIDVLHLIKFNKDIRTFANAYKHNFEVNWAYNNVHDIRCDNFSNTSYIVYEDNKVYVLNFNRICFLSNMYDKYCNIKCNVGSGKKSWKEYLKDNFRHGLRMNNPHYPNIKL